MKFLILPALAPLYGIAAATVRKLWLVINIGHNPNEAKEVRVTRKRLSGPSGFTSKIDSILTSAYYLVTLGQCVPESLFGLLLIRALIEYDWI